MVRGALLLVLCWLLALPVTAQDSVGLRLQEASGQLVKGNAGVAVTIYSDLLKDSGLAGDRRAIIHNDRGVAQARLGQTKLALDDFNRAVQLFPEHAPTYNNRGSLLLSVGLVREAIKDFDRAVVLSPAYAAAFANRGSAHLKLGEAQQAVADYTKAIELVPVSAPALSGRGRALLLVERPHAAIRDFTRAVNADGRFAGSYRNRAEAKLALEKTEEAIEDLSRAIAFDPANLEVYVLRGYAYLFARNPASAIKDFTHAIEMDPQAAAAYEARALAYAVADAATEASADVNRALEIDPRSAVAFAYRGYIHQRAGQIELASRDVASAVKLAPNRAEVQWVKGEIEQQQGKPEQAVASFRQALALKPTYKLASDSLERIGARASEADETERPGLGVERWRVVKRGSRYVALHDDYRKLAVPLEMVGDGEPRLLEWEVKKAPLKGIGTLRFHAGVVAGKAGAEETEQVAILDLFASNVIAIQPHRQGAKVSNWTWDEGKVTVQSIDGVTDDLVLRQVKAKDQVAQAQPRRSGQGGDPAWAPWQPWETNQRSSGGGSRQARSGGGQPKTLFQLLFGN